MTRLAKALLDGYDNQVPPLSTTVRVQLAIKSIPSFDTLTQRLALYGWWRLYWTDHRLTWDPAKYDGVDFIALRYEDGNSGSAWIPDVAVYESQGRYENLPHGIPVSCYSSGSCFVSRPIQDEVLCPIRARNFPFDTQACEITVGSWSFSGDYFDVKPKVDSDGTFQAADVSHYDSNPEYKLSKIESSHIDNYYTCCPEPYPTVSFRLYLERYPNSYISSTIVPLILVTACSIIGLLMNPDSGERLALAITVVLAQGVLFLTAVGFLPKVAGRTFIQDLYSYSNAISVFILIESVIVVSLYAVKPSENVLSEAALWTTWIHQGMLSAVTEVRLLVIDATSFQEIACKFHSDLVVIRHT